MEVELSDPLPGATKTAARRGKPVSVLRHTPAMLAALPGHDRELADPDSLRDRPPSCAQKPARVIKPAPSRLGTPPFRLARDTRIGIGDAA